MNLEAQLREGSAEAQHYRVRENRRDSRVPEGYGY